MKYIKFFVGLLLFVSPITFHVMTDQSWTMNAPIGTLHYSTTFFTTEFAVHSFQWYTGEGRDAYVLDVFAELKTAGMTVSSFMFDPSVSPRALDLRGIFTIITLWAIVVYLIFAIIDQKILNLIADILLLGLMGLSLFTYFDYQSILFSPEYGIPIFAIISGLLGLVGLIFSSLRIMNKLK